LTAEPHAHLPQGALQPVDQLQQGLRPGAIVNISDLHPEFVGVVFPFVFVKAEFVGYTQIFAIVTALNRRILQ
jgi:hypothetical protein